MLISRQVVSLEKEAVREALGVRQWGRSGAATTEWAGEGGVEAGLRGGDLGCRGF